VICFASLLVFTVAAAGREAVVGYFHTMSRISNILLLSENNQSFAAWWLGHSYPSPASIGFRTLPLPRVMKSLCLALVILTAIIGGYCDRRLASVNSSIPPYGAVFALLGATVFSPIAWSHYYIFLIVPIILLIDDSFRNRSYPLLLLPASIFFLANSTVLLRQLQRLHFPAVEIVRGQFYAGILALIGMLLMYHRRRMEVVRARASASAT
jgi:hypothetical protein